MNVEIEGNLPDFTRDAIRKIEQLGGQAFLIAHRAAQEEVSTKTYVDRTGRLRANTRATLVMGGDGWTVTLDMGSAEILYGTFVQALGYSNFEALATIAAMDIDKLMKRAGYSVQGLSW